MVAWIILPLSLVATLLSPPGMEAQATPSAPNPWSCVEQALEEMGYSTVVPPGSTRVVRGERRAGGALARIKEASAFATGVATLGLIQPPIERRFDVLSISLSQSRLHVAAALVVREGEARKRQWPRARAVVDAMRLSAECDARR